MTISLSGTERTNKNYQQSWHQSVQYQSPDDNNMILPLMKMTLSTNFRGQDNLRTQVPDSIPPTADHLHTGDDMNDILDIIGNHQFIDDIAGTYQFKWNHDQGKSTL